MQTNTSFHFDVLSLIVDNLLYAHIFLQYSSR
jgi:hypothetical protein